MTCSTVRRIAHQRPLRLQTRLIASRPLLEKTAEINTLMSYILSPEICSPPDRLQNLAMYKKRPSHLLIFSFSRVVSWGNPKSQTSALLFNEQQAYTFSNFGGFVIYDGVAYINFVLSTTKPPEITNGIINISYMTSCNRPPKEKHLPN